MNASSKANKYHWASLQEAGTLTGLRFLFLLYRIFGKRFYSIVMYPVALYFVLCNGVARRASQQYLHYHWQAHSECWKRKPNLLNSIAHFKCFAETILDKGLAWCIEMSEDEFVIDDFSIIETLMADTRGQLIIGTHFGNLEYCRGFMQRYKQKIINILVYDKHSANFVEIMQRLNPDSRINIFQVDEFDVPTILLLKQKIDQGEWVFIAGDRVPLSGLEHTISVEFLNHKAPLPMGPYLLAKALACPVKLMFGYRHPGLGDKKVYFEVVPFADKISFSRTDRETILGDYAQQFASHLERHCQQAPYQWFNFYSFWSTTKKVKNSLPTTAKEGV